jgi:hypothetical protein
MLAHHRGRSTQILLWINYIVNIIEAYLVIYRHWESKSIVHPVGNFIDRIYCNHFNRERMRQGVPV